MLVKTPTPGQLPDITVATRDWCILRLASSPRCFCDVALAATTRERRGVRVDALVQHPLPSARLGARRLRGGTGFGSPGAVQDFGALTSPPSPPVDEHR